MSNFTTTQILMSVEHSIKSRLWSDILPNASFYLYALPILLLLGGALVTIILGVFKSDASKPSYSSWIVAVFVSFLASVIAICFPAQEPQAFLGSGFLIDGISSMSFAIIALGTVFTFIAAASTTNGRNLLRFELLSLILFASAGMMIMCSSGEFMSFFIGLELMSIPLYVLVGYMRKDIRSIEGAVKYFLMGAVAAAVLLMGAALIYASIGSLRFSDFHLITISIHHPFSLLGILMVICGLMFKLAIVPFHAWAPDVYQSANSHLTGYMASLVKFSVAVVILRLLCLPFIDGSQSTLITLFWILAVLSIGVGSLFGLVNNSLKRMLAYSSIANAGYLCLAFISLLSNPTDLEPKQALMAYIIIYAVLSLGAFNVIAWLEDSNREDLLKEELSGIAYKKPFAAFALSIFLFGFAGIPPVAGFFGKFLLLLSAVHQGFIWLSIILILFSCVSLYYYLSVIVEMWFKPAGRYSIENNQSAESNTTMKTLALITVLAALAIGFLGPRYAMNLNYTQAIEKNIHIIHTADNK